MSSGPAGWAPARRAPSPSSGRASCCRIAPAPARLRRAFGRNAPLVLEIGFGMGDATAQIAAARPDDRLPRHRGAPARASARCCKRIGERGLDQPAHRPARRGRGARAHDRARLAGRRARVLSRPVAQEAHTQAPADPARLRRGCSRAASRRAATCTAPPTGSPTPSRCSRCCRPSRRLRNTADGYAPSGRRCGR